MIFLSQRVRAFLNKKKTLKRRNVNENERYQIIIHIRIVSENETLMSGSMQTKKECIFS